MSSTIDMRLMRYLNLFSNISKVKTLNCFIYNNQIGFAVPESQVSKAIGKNASNVKKLGNILGKKIKILKMPKEINADSIKEFLEELTGVEGINVEIENDLVKIGGTRQVKASLIGRNRAREKEIQEILASCFGFKKILIV